MTRTLRKTTTHQPKAPVREGSFLDGYRVDRVLSVRSGLYTLARATSPSGEAVTIKLLTQPLEGKETRRRVAKLASLRASIEHAHLLPLLRSGENGQRLYLRGIPENAMTLEDRLREGPLAPKEAVRLLSEVAGALGAAQARGMLHRELAPASIIVTGDEPAKVLLTDFGIAAPANRANEIHGAVEDIDYRSPEEIRGLQLRPESNVYSLACILVECLTGAPPYPYNRPLLALHAHLVEPPPRVTERRHELPSALDLVISKAMAKEPLSRYQSPAELMHTAQQALGIKLPIPVHAPPEPVKDTVHGPLRERRPAPARVPERRPAPLHERKPAPARPPERRRPVTERPPVLPPERRRPVGEPTPTPVPERTPAAAEPESRQPAAKPVHAPEPKEPRVRRGLRRQPGAAAPRRRRVAVSLPRPAVGWVGIALLVSAVGGFASGNLGASGEQSRSSAAPAPAPRAQPSQHSVSVRTVDRAVKRLDARRTALRRKLRAARRPAGQAAAARSLAGAYRDAREALASSPGKVRGEDLLSERLLTVERAYGSLAAAAKGGDEGAWQAASADALAAEDDLELLLRTRRWT
jgi:serine/threonine protein kinase